MTTKTSKALTYVYEPYKNSKTVTHERFWRPHIFTINKAFLFVGALLSVAPLREGRNATKTTQVLLLFKRKEKQKNAFSWAKNTKTPLVACVFYLVLICTWFWLNVNRYTCVWHLPFFKGMCFPHSNKLHTCRIDTVVPIIKYLYILSYTTEYWSFRFSFSSEKQF